ncbi:hypothetical protein E2R51_13970 [Jeotgalibacillus sp. S-D1]|uniref:hypothetical protein n=1 Tax=Jeotgalibacillus sp. S-D1 TaxID=2552189 RepID=UPI0010E8111B|nr:hypothetical protein [Jeotgalibacillus sp. S-D1]TDL31467.1 hypothetical protein E2R51_13970 [Jeotgalibacillus sp. S-D1]
MSLSNVSLGETIKNQYLYKITSYSDAVKSLMIVQLIAIMFTVSMVTSIGSMGDGLMHITINEYTIDATIVFMILWVFITSILVTTKSYQYEDFSFVTNRLSSQLANLLFLLTAVTAGVVSTIMSSYLIYYIVLIISDKQLLGGVNILASGSEMSFTAIVIFLYMLLASSAGYAAGALTQISRLFIPLLSAVLVMGSIFFANSTFLRTFYSFYFSESSLLLFSAKCLVTSSILFAAAVFIMQSREVRS